MHTGNSFLMILRINHGWGLSYQIDNEFLRDIQKESCWSSRIIPDLFDTYAKANQKILDGFLHIIANHKYSTITLRILCIFFITICWWSKFRLQFQTYFPLTAFLWLSFVSRKCCLFFFLFSLIIFYPFLLLYSTYLSSKASSFFFVL